MDGKQANSVNRREFLQTGAIATASAVSLSQASQAAPPASKPTLPQRALGKTGVQVTLLELGTWLSPGTGRLLRFAYQNGVRAFDTADCYGSEPAFAEWFRAAPEVRKQIFLVTKDHPRSPRQLESMLDVRLEKLGTEYVDLLLIHGIGPGGYGRQSLQWPKSRELKQTIEAIKKSGKAKFVGFSCHDALRAEYLQAAAAGGFVDAIMLQFTPWLEKGSALNKAIDACHQRGIGLISMKQVAGHGDLDRVAGHIPGLAAMGLTPYQGLLTAIWSDERIAMACVSMRNTDQIRENSVAAAKFKPLDQAAVNELRDACLAARPTFCADCDGRCARAAGTAAPLGDLARLVTYYEQYGHRAEARRQFAGLPEDARDWSTADLAAAQAACPSRLDFAELLRRAQQHLA